MARPTKSGDVNGSTTRCPCCIVIAGYPFAIPPLSNLAQCTKRVYLRVHTSPSRIMNICLPLDVPITFPPTSTKLIYGMLVHILGCSQTRQRRPTVARDTLSWCLLSVFSLIVSFLLFLNLRSNSPHPRMLIAPS